MAPAFKQIFTMRLWKGILIAVIMASALIIGTLYTFENKTDLNSRTRRPIPVDRIQSIMQLKSRGGNFMILSYMRGGSSMNGQVFADDRDNFYVYEPLIKLAPYHYLTEDRYCEMRELKCRVADEPRDVPQTVLHKADTINATKTSIDRKENFSAMTTVKFILKKVTVKKSEIIQVRANVIHNLKNIYNCNIRSLDDRVLRSIMFEQKGKVKSVSKSGESWTNFTNCYAKLVEPNMTNMPKFIEDARTVNFEKHKNVMGLLDVDGPRAKVFQKCLNQLEMNCRKSKIKVTKVLRLSLRILPLLLSEIPDLKVLFVIRDPRGILNSRIKTSWFPITDNDTKAVTDNIESLCFKMDEDVKMINNLKQNFSGRFIDLRLEDIATNPMKHFNMIFRFINLRLTDVYKEQIKKVVGEKPSFLSTWYTALDKNYIKLIEENCRYVLKTFNYKFVYS